MKPKANPAQPPHRQTVLLAVTGMSPAILTETVWALAHENPPVIPHRVIAITTLAGKGRLESDLFTPQPEYGQRTVWDALRHALLGPSANEDARLILEEAHLIAGTDTAQGRSFALEDIRTPADNEQAADFILEEIRKITENPDTALVASLAGGRKTMGALLYAGLSLLGRPQDRLTHVLVSEPFEDPGLKPRFYFPMQPDTLHEHPRTGAVHRGDAARLWLADVPFVRLRELFPRQLGRYPGQFSSLVNLYARQIQELTGPPSVRLLSDRPALLVDQRPVELSGREYLVYAFLLHCHRTGAPTSGQQKDCLDDLCAFVAKVKTDHPPEDFRQNAAAEWQRISDDDVRRQLCSLRQKMKRSGLEHQIPNLLPVRGRFGILVK